MGPPLATSLASLGLYDSTIHAFAEALQGMVVAALVGGGGSWDRHDPGQAIRDPWGSFLGGAQEWDVLDFNSFLAQLVSGVDHIFDLERVLHRVRPGRNG